jgi:hypothetical protein
MGQEGEKASLTRHARGRCRLGLEDRTEQTGCLCILDDRWQDQRSRWALAANRFGRTCHELERRVEAPIRKTLIARWLDGVGLVRSHGTQRTSRGRVEGAAVAKTIRACPHDADGIGGMGMAGKIRAMVDGLDELEAAEIAGDANASRAVHRDDFTSHGPHVLDDLAGKRPE